MNKELRVCIVTGFTVYARAICSRLLIVGLDFTFARDVESHASVRDL